MITESKQPSTPDRVGVYAWVTSDGHASLVVVSKRPTSHSPAGVLNGSVIESSTFYDGCPVEQWGADGRWVLLHDFDVNRAALSPASTEAAPTQPAIGPLAERAVFDAIRGAYDLGYSDARKRRSVPGDGAPGYEGRTVEADHGGALVARLKVLVSGRAPQHASMDSVRQAIRDYHHALDTRQHGCVAADRALKAIQGALGMYWQPGKELAARQQNGET